MLILINDVLVNHLFVVSALLEPQRLLFTAKLRGARGALAVVLVKVNCPIIPDRLLRFKERHIRNLSVIARWMPDALFF
jgi:hypothetical protein